MIDSIDVDIPDTLIDDETEHRVAHAGERAQRAGLSLDDLLDAQGWDESRPERTHGTMRSARSRPTWRSKASRGPRRSRSRPTSWAPRSPPLQSYGRDSKELAKQLERSGQIVTLAGDIIRARRSISWSTCRHRTRITGRNRRNRRGRDGRRRSRSRDRDLRRHRGEAMTEMRSNITANDYLVPVVVEQTSRGSARSTSTRAC